MKEKSPVVILWELAHKEHSKLKTSVFIATVGVIAEVIPYIAASHILIYRRQIGRASCRARV